jgi:hypothetical protein
MKRFSNFSGCESVVDKLKLDFKLVICFYFRDVKLGI